MLKDLLISLSLANLCLIRGWANVYFTLSSKNQYYMNYPSSLNSFASVLLLVILLGLTFFIGITIVRRSGNSTALKIARWIFILFFILPISGVITEFYYVEIDRLKIFFIIAFILIFLTLIIRLLLYSRQRISNMLANILRIMLPLLVLNVVYTSWLIIKIDPESFLDKPSAEIVSTKNNTDPKVLWLMFDEMGQQITFENQFYSVKLPEIERLRSESFYASNSYPPGDETGLTIPSLISGKMISGFTPVSPSEMLVQKYGTNEMSGWSTYPDIFSDANKLGYNTSLIGWYLPYGRVIGSSLTECSWYPYETYRYLTFRESLLNQLEILIDTIPYGKHYRLSNQIYIMDILAQGERINTYHKIMNKVKENAVNPAPGLVFVHWPVPHPPGLYDRSKNDFLLKGGSYLDNLVLVDNTIGELRRAMEEAGTWESTTIVFTSDHRWRAAKWSEKPLWTEEDTEVSLFDNIDQRVPFIIKLAGQNEPVEYSNVFNSIISHDLILALLNKDISNTKELVEWIDNNRTKWEIPKYNLNQSKKDVS